MGEISTGQETVDKGRSLVFARLVRGGESGKPEVDEEALARARRTCYQKTLQREKFASEQTAVGSIRNTCLRCG